MNTEEKVAWLEGRKGMNHDVNTFRQIVDKLVPGHGRLKLIQVGGTNGKGSVVEWMREMADVGKVGTFTSPHLVSHFERMRINGKNIPPEVWEKYFDQEMVEKYDLTMFEADLVMALQWFVDEGVDVGLIEVGLGGRKDASTALDYEAIGITNIGLDHMGLLGETKEQIAGEKAGVLKPGVPSATTEQELFPVLQEYDANLQLVHPAFITGLPPYQGANKALAKTLLDLAGIKRKAVLDADFFWAGRYQTVRTGPLLLVDGAHNLPGVQALVQARPEVDVIYFSVLADKQAKAMLEELDTLGIPIVLVHFDSPRLADLEALGRPVISTEELLQKLKSETKRALCCGSLYFVGEILSVF